MSQKKQNIKIDIPFLLYFVVMFCLYTIGYIQLFTQIGIIIYVAYRALEQRVIKQHQIKDICFMVFWFGVLTFMLFLSQTWAYDIYDGSKTLITTLRIFFMGIVIYLYCDSKERVLSLLVSMIYAVCIMGIVAMITTPIKLYGTVEFGKTIGQHRNQIGAISAQLMVLCYFLDKKIVFPVGKFLSAFLMILLVCSGSRGAMLQVIIIVGLCAIFLPDNRNSLIRNILIFLVLFSVVAILIYMVPFLHNIIWVRIENMIETFLGGVRTDKSTWGRNAYQQIAWIILKDSPVLGYGVDGFICFLRDNDNIIGYHLEPVYSHCNYTELMSSLGILGLLIWYVPVLKTFFSMILIKKKNKWCVILIAVFVSMLILDYARIPWSTHLAMYFYFIMMLMCRYEVRGFKENTICYTRIGEIG